MAQPGGLRAVSKQILMENMIQHAVATSGMPFLCLVADAEGRRVLGGSVKMSELVAEGITHVEDLCLSPWEREPQPDLGAIYFVAPTEASIDRLLFDFPAGGPGKYAQAWVFFTGRIPDALFVKLQSANPEFKRAMKCCRELLIEFTPLPVVDGRAFSLAVPELAKDLYSTEREGGASAARTRTIERLFQLCISLGEVPETVFFELDEGSRGKANGGLGTAMDMYQIAMELHAKLEEFNGQRGSAQEKYMRDMAKKKDACFGIKRGGHRNEPPLLVLLDRTADPAGPLIHDLCYEGMCHDVLDVNEYGEVLDEGKKPLIETADSNEGSETQDQDKCPVCGQKRAGALCKCGHAADAWVSYRETHLAHPLSDVITTGFKKFQEEFAFMEESAPQSRRMESQRVARLKEHNAKKKMWAGHLTVAEMLMKSFNSRKLGDGLCALESDLVMGRDPFQAKLDAKGLRERCIEKLLEIDNDEDKMRLIATWWLCSESKAGGGERLMTEVCVAAWPSGLSESHEAVVHQLKSFNFNTNLDVLSEKNGTGSKKKVCYGYGEHRRRHETEATGESAQAHLLHAFWRFWALFWPVLTSPSVIVAQVRSVIRRTRAVAVEDSKDFSSRLRSSHSQIRCHDIGRRCIGCLRIWQRARETRPRSIGKVFIVMVLRSRHTHCSMYTLTRTHSTQFA